MQQLWQLLASRWAAPIGEAQLLPSWLPMAAAAPCAIRIEWIRLVLHVAPTTDLFFPALSKIPYAFLASAAFTAPRTRCLFSMLEHYPMFPKPIYLPVACVSPRPASLVHRMLQQAQLFPPETCFSTVINQCSSAARAQMGCRDAADSAAGQLLCLHCFPPHPAAIQPSSIPFSGLQSAYPQRSLRYRPPCACCSSDPSVSIRMRACFTPGLL